MITVVDYGTSNLRSVVNAFEAIGTKTRVTNDPSDLRNASAIVLPGVGAFGDGMHSLRRLDLIDPLNEQVLVKRRPFLGICLGLQFLAEESLEHGVHKGLGWISGTVQKISPCDSRCRVPHIGWNNIQVAYHNALFEGLDREPVFYFVHSYQFVAKPEFTDVVSSSCWHGTKITASVQKEHIFGVQFHPEKSQRNGLTVLENFVKFV